MSIDQAAGSASALLRQENETLKRELADVRARMERKDAALREIVSWDEAIDPPYRNIVDAFETARAALQEGTG